VVHLAQLAEFARTDEWLLDELAVERLATVVKKENDKKIISISELFPPNGPYHFAALIPRMLRRLIEEVKIGKGQISARHVETVLELARNGENGKFILLPGGVEVRRERENLVFLADSRGNANDAGNTSSRHNHEKGERKNKKATPRLYEYKIVMAGDTQAVHVPELGCVFRLREIDWTAKRGETSYLGAVLDRDRLEFPLVLRNWRPGDRFQPVGHRSAHKVKRLLNEKRVSRWERDGWPVVTSGGILVWARGFPAAVAFAANDTTQTGIVIAEEKHK